MCHDDVKRLYFSPGSELDPSTCGAMNTRLNIAATIGIESILVSRLINSIVTLSALVSDVRRLWRVEFFRTCYVLQTSTLLL